jgi:DNA-binding LytR/AlgR family response regulator
MFTCAIIDDEPPAIEILENYVQKIPFLNHIASFDSAVEAAIALKAKPVDLVFVDIHMPELSGVQLVKLLNGLSKIIFTTAHRQYALEGYDYHIVDYLLKPIAFERFLAAVQKLPQAAALPYPQESMSAIESKMAETIFVKTQNKIVQIALAEIVYIEGLGNYLTLHCTTERFVVHGAIKDFEERLPAAQFKRVHKSYLIAIDRIKAVEGNQILLSHMPHQPVKIPLGAAYRTAFMRYLQERILN